MRTLNVWNNAAVALICAVMMVFIISCYAGSRADHFNRLASNAESQAERVVASLGLKPGDTVADIGSGGGYFTVLMARAVGPKGTVYAVDIDAALLKHVDDLAKKEGFSNVTTVRATESGTGIPGRCVDMVFMRNVFHDLKGDSAYFIRLRSVLKAGGRVAVIDYRPETLLKRLFGHFIDEAEIVSLMKSAGYGVAERHTYLEEQSFNIFVPAAAGTGSGYL